MYTFKKLYAKSSFFLFPTKKKKKKKSLLLFVHEQTPSRGLKSSKFTIFIFLKKKKKNKMKICYGTVGLTWDIYELTLHAH
jgi:hypothetical protein